MERLAVGALVYQEVAGHLVGRPNLDSAQFACLLSIPIGVCIFGPTNEAEIRLKLQISIERSRIAKLFRFNPLAYEPPNGDQPSEEKTEDSGRQLEVNKKSIS